MDIQVITEAICNIHADKAIENNLLKMVESYQKALKHSSSDKSKLVELFLKYLHFVQESITSPPDFGHIHYAEHYPIDYYEFAKNFIRPLIDEEHSIILGKEHLKEISEAIDRRENVILLANHQTEIDPQIMSILLDPINERLSSSMFFLAGHRVTTDPLAIPFSRGTNILPIHSKKYIDSPPELRTEKLQHNAKTLSLVSELLNEGGACIYVAASNGRDRADESGQATVSPFDPQSVEMLHLLGKNSTQTTHFHILALSTMALLPPPPTVNIELGEDRIVHYAPAGLDFGPKLILEQLGSSGDRRERRVERSEILTQNVTERHATLHKILQPFFTLFP
jgi:glycerol-3-phosphate O-acyltransferase